MAMGTHSSVSTVVSKISSGVGRMSHTGNTPSESECRQALLHVKCHT